MLEVLKNIQYLDMLAGDSKFRGRVPRLNPEQRIGVAFVMTITPHDTVS